MKIKSKKSKKLLIFIYSYRFSKIDWERFEIGYFKKFYDVKIHDLLDLIWPNYSIGFHNVYENKIIFRFNNFFKWILDIFDCIKAYRKENIYIVTNLSYESFIEKCILITLSLLKFKIVNFYLPGVAISNVNKKENKSNFAFLSKISKARNFNIIFDVLFNYFFSIINQKRYSILTNYSDLEKIRKRYPFSNLIKGSSFDYSTFLREKNSINLNFRRKLPKKYAVHIDGAGPAFLGDEYIYNEKNPESINSWYGKLNRLFKFIEEAYNLEFVIAAHPKTDVRIVSQLYDNRKTFLGKTLYLIRDSEFVTTRQSTAISYAILFNKPIQFLTSNALLNWDHSNKSVRPILNALNQDQFNIDDLDYSCKFEIPRFDREIYLRYKQKWLSSENLPNYQIIVNCFENY